MCAGRSLHSMRKTKANPARKRRRACLLVPFDASPIVRFEAGWERREFNDEHGYLWVSSSFSLCRGAPRRRPRPSRLSSAAARRGLSQRPGHALVRHFDVVQRVDAFRIRVFTLFCSAQRDVRGLHGPTRRFRGPDPDAVAPPRRDPLPAAVRRVDRAGPRVKRHIPSYPSPHRS